MAKAAKSSGGSPEKPAQPEKPVKDYGSHSLFKAGLTFVAAVLAIQLLLQGAVGGLLWLASGKVRDNEADLLQRHTLAAINSVIDRANVAADQLAANPLPLLAALAGGSAGSAEKQLLQTTAGSVDVRVVSAALDPVQANSLSYGQQDMVTRVAQSGKPLPMELGRLHDAKVLTLARPLKDASGAVQGVLMISYPIKLLNDALAPLQVGGARIEIGQGFDKDKSTLVAGSGDGVAISGSLMASSTNNPNWELRFAPAASLGREALMLPVQAALLIVSVLACSLFVLGLRLLDGRLDADVEDLGRFAENFARFGERSRRSLNFANLDLLQQKLELYLGELRSGGNGRVLSSPTSQAMQSLQIGEEDSAMLLGPGSSVADELDAIMAEPAVPAAAPRAKSSGIAPEIFRAYDIRGRAGGNLTGDVVRQLAMAIGSESSARAQQTVIVGRDARVSSPDLHKQLIEGLKRSGRDVIDIGVVPTPVVYFAANTLPAQSAVMLTASHNPPEDNGLKVMIAGKTLVAEDIQRLRQRVEQQDFTTGSGGYSQQNISADYIERISSDVVLARSLTVVVDAGNGVAGPIGVRVLEALGCKVVPLYCDPDGRFPNHQPDPSRAENLEDLQSAVVLNDAHLGIAFDGDGDRLGVVTGSGEVVAADRVMMLLAKHVLVTHPGADIVFDVKCSRELMNVITSHGGRPVMSRTGHSYLKAKLAETGAPLAGELSGHIIFNDRWFGFDDAIYAAARLLEILSLESDDADAVFGEFPETVATPELSFPMADDVKAAFVEMLAQKANFMGGTLNKLDGLRVDFSDGWGLIRASNTTPSIVMRFEGRDESVVQRIQAQFRDAVHMVDGSVELPF